MDRETTKTDLRNKHKQLEDWQAVSISINSTWFDKRCNIVYVMKSIKT